MRVAQSLSKPLSRAGLGLSTGMARSYTLPPMLRRFRFSALALAVASLTVAVASPTAAVSSIDELLDAPVPSLCGLPAGTLDNGVLPGTPAGESLTLKTELSRTGDLWGSRRSEAVAILQCIVGPSTAVDFIVVYNANGRPVASWDVGRFTGAGGWVTGAVVKKRVATIRVEDVQQDGEAPCCGTADAVIKLRWNADQKRVTAKKAILTEKRTQRRLVAALNAGDVARAEKLADESVVSNLMLFRTRGANSFEAGGCFAGDSFYGSDRVCDIYAPGVDVAVHLDRVKFGSWRGIAYQLID